MSNDTNLIKFDPFPESTKESLFNPTASALGKSFGGVVSFISIPFRNLGIWSEMQINNFEKNVVAKNLEIPENNRDFSKLQQTAKFIDDAKFSLGEEDLQELFTNLISSSLDNRINSNIHPSFSTILKDFSPEDAILFKKICLESNIPIVSISLHTKGTDNGIDVEKNTILFESENIISPKELNSLERLGLINIDETRHLLAGTFAKRYTNYENSHIFQQYKIGLPIESGTSAPLDDITLKKGYLELTEFGIALKKVIIIN